jgi:hypothetical protein
MKKIIALSVFMMFALGCSNDSDSEFAQGQWSLKSFKMQVFAEQVNKRDTGTGVWTLQPVEKYTEDKTFTYFADGVSKSDTRSMVRDVNGFSEEVYSNDNKILKTADYWNGQYSGRQYDFSIDKQIYETYTDGIVIKKVTYFYR